MSQIGCPSMFNSFIPAYINNSYALDEKTINNRIFEFGEKTIEFYQLQGKQKEFLKKIEKKDSPKYQPTIEKYKEAAKKLDTLHLQELKDINESLQHHSCTDKKLANLIGDLDQKITKCKTYISKLQDSLGNGKKKARQNASPKHQQITIQKERLNELISFRIRLDERVKKYSDACRFADAYSLSRAEIHCEMACFNIERRDELEKIRDEVESQPYHSFRIDVTRSNKEQEEKKKVTVYINAQPIHFSVSIPKKNSAIHFSVSIPKKNSAMDDTASRVSSAFNRIIGSR